MTIAKDRLLRLADLLEADAKEKKGVKFDLGTWANRKQNKRRKTLDVDCGTHACAVGLACISGVFRNEGLSYTMHPSMTDDTVQIRPSFEGKGNWNAVSDFFGLTHRQAERLFVKDYYETTRGAKAERRVAQRIRDFVLFAAA